MKNFWCVVAFMLVAVSKMWAQYPALEFNIANVTTSSSGTVDVNLTAGSNWQNITNFRGTFVFDTTVITWNSMQNWGLSYPAGASFVYAGAGQLRFTWQSLITVGPTLSNGSVIFTLRFNVVGSPGMVSPITFANSPQAMYWYNGFGWSGTNFQVGAGSVTLFCAQPVASFTSSANLYQYGFTSTGAGVQQWHWDFGDGATATVANPSHTYAQSGTYTVCLIATNACGSDTTCTTLNVCPLPNATFNYTANQLAVNFNGASPNNPTSWHWDFGDGTTSTLQNPSHTYGVPGTYTACLIVDNGCAADTFCQSLLVGCPAPSVAFTDSADGLSHFFTDLSSNNPTSWLWDFGDGNFSSLQSPFHNYAAPGTYTVCLRASSLCGADSTCTTVTVSCAAPNAGFTALVLGAVVQLTDTSTLNPTTWAWDFGDGNQSSQQNPAHTYAVDGLYTICLVASSVCGSDTTCFDVLINTVGVGAAVSDAVSLWPNPAHDRVTVRGLGQLQVQLYGLRGERIMGMQGNDTVALDLGHVAAGVYMVLVDVDGRRTAHKLVVR